MTATPIWVPKAMPASSVRGRSRPRTAARARAAPALALAVIGRSPSGSSRPSAHCGGIGRSPTRCHGLPGRPPQLIRSGAVDLPSALRPAADAVVRPMRTLWLLSAAHAVNHAQAVLLPLIYLKIIDEFGVSIGAVAVLAGVSSFASGMVQLSFASLTRYVPRRVLLGLGGLVFGGGQVLLGAATSFLPFAATHIAMRVGGAPQHPVGNGLLAAQVPPHRRGLALR